MNYICSVATYISEILWLLSTFSSPVLHICIHLSVVQLQRILTLRLAAQWPGRKPRRDCEASNTARELPADADSPTPVAAQAASASRPCWTACAMRIVVSLCLYDSPIKLITIGTCLTAQFARAVMLFILKPMIYET